MRAELFVPGYTQKAFSHVRASLYHAASDIHTHNTAIKYFSNVSVEALVLGTRLIDHPIRVIEVLALTAINLVGSCFSQGLSDNVDAAHPHFLGVQFICAVWAGAAAVPPLALITMVAYVALSPIRSSYSLEERGDRELLTAYTIELLQKNPKLANKIPLKPIGNTKEHLQFARNLLTCKDQKKQEEILVGWQKKVVYAGFTNALNKSRI